MAVFALKDSLGLPKPTLFRRREKKKSKVNEGDERQSDMTAAVFG